MNNSDWYKKVKHLISSTAFLLSFIVVLTAGAQSAVFEGTEDDEIIPPKVTSGGAIVMDFETGEELFAHDADEPYYPASMTKMMTAYLVYQAIENGEIGLDTIVPISASTEEFSHSFGVSNTPLLRSEAYTVDDLLNITIAVSASGAAVALAELVGGTRQEFVRLMNDKAAEWRIDAHFESMFGGGERTQVTARAMATIARNTILQFPEVLEKTSSASIEFGGRTRRNTNRLLGVYDGMDGYKTGTTVNQEENITATAERGGIRIIAVTLHSKPGKRYDDIEKLLDYGFAVMEARLEAVRLEEERLEQERLEAARLEEERLEEERLKKEAYFEALRLEEERLEREAQLELARQKTRQEEAARLETARLEKERAIAERARIDNAIAIIVCSVLIFSIIGVSVAIYHKKFVHKRKHKIDR